MLECSQLIKGNGKLPKRMQPLGRGGTATLTINGELSIDRLRSVFSGLKQVTDIYKKGCKRIVFVCDGAFKPVDALTYIILECILYTLKFRYGYDVIFKGGKFEPKAKTPGIKDSLVRCFKGEESDWKELEKRYSKQHTGNHFRRIVDANEPEQISVLLSELKTFFKPFQMNDEFGEKMASVVAELVDNACEHTFTDCLADIYVSEPVYQKKGSKDFFYAISIVVLNFSEKCLGSDLKNKIINEEYVDSERYECVHKAYLNHQTFISKKPDYNEDDFFNITTFQHRISGRKNESKTGGKGLTELIKSLEDRAEAHSCYVISGKQGLWFEPGFLEYNEENWIGFNRENDYFNMAPDEEILNRVGIELPGTGYNFNLIVKKEEA